MNLLTQALNNKYTNSYISTYQNGAKNASASAIASSNIGNSQSLVEQGNSYLRVNEFDKAVECYEKAVQMSPDDLTIYLKLGKAYKGKEDYANASQSLENYIASAPDDTDATILLGECYNKQGQYVKAQAQYERAIELDPSNDSAQRSLLETKNNILNCYDPSTAIVQKRQQALNNLNQALSLAKGYLPAGYFKDMGDLVISFDKTAQMGGTSNIAQYEHGQRKITVTDNYIYAAPQLVTAYLVHEFVHAKDKDAYTSIREEQDAYRQAAEFWIQNSNGIKDPEMDYAAGLYKQSPTALDKRVEEIYTLRDPQIARTSPNHPPNSKRSAASQALSANSGQPLKENAVIS